ncbi:hypothetical protein EV121DRAFT_283115 [Schizophyllum commune]
MLHHAKQKAKQLVGHVVPGVAESYSGGGGRQKAARKSGKKYRRAEKSDRGRTNYDGSRMPAPQPNVARPLHPAVHRHAQVVTPGPSYSYLQSQVPAPPPKAHYYGQPERRPRSQYAPGREHPEHDPGHKVAYAPLPPSHRPRRPSVPHPEPYLAMPSYAPRPPPPTHATNMGWAAPVRYPLHYGYLY